MCTTRLKKALKKAVHGKQNQKGNGKQSKKPTDRQTRKAPGTRPTDSTKQKPKSQSPREKHQKAAGEAFGKYQKGVPPEDLLYGEELI